MSAILGAVRALKASLINKGSRISSREWIAFPFILLSSLFLFVTLGIYRYTYSQITDTVWGNRLILFGCFHKIRYSTIFWDFNLFFLESISHLEKREGRRLLSKWISFSNHCASKCVYYSLSLANQLSRRSKNSKILLYFTREQIISEEYCHYRHMRFSSCNCISNNCQAAQFDSQESSQINFSFLLSLSFFHLFSREIFIEKFLTGTRGKENKNFKILFYLMRRRTIKLPSFA